MSSFRAQGTLFDSAGANTIATTLNVQAGDTIIVAASSNSTQNGMSDVDGNVYTPRVLDLDHAQQGVRFMSVWTAIASVNNAALSITVAFDNTTNDRYIHTSSFFDGVDTFLGFASANPSGTAATFSGGVPPLIAIATLLVGHARVVGLNNCPIGAGAGFTTMNNIGPGTNDCMRGIYMLNPLTNDDANFTTQSGTGGWGGWSLAFGPQGLIGRRASGRRERRR
jgi:hypothetical protein